MRRPRTATAGFTLLEVMLAMIIVGTGVLAIMAAQQAFHRENAWATRSSTAVAMANHVREAIWRLPQHDPVTVCEHWGPEDNEVLLDAQGRPDLSLYDDLDDWSGLELDPPIDSLRRRLPDLAGWRQYVTIEHVDPFDINRVRSDTTDCPTDTMKITVRVTYTTVHAPQEQVGTTVWWIAPRG